MSQLNPNQSANFKVKTGLKAGVDGDPCGPVWYSGYENGHFDGFTAGYVDQANNRPYYPNQGSQPYQQPYYYANYNNNPYNTYVPANYANPTNFNNQGHPNSVQDLQQYRR